MESGLSMRAEASSSYQLAVPRPEALIESLRAVGYSLSTALADIVDNSIAADARRIWIAFHWAGPETTISILDDGKGMSEDTLLDAMRPGTQSPLAERGPNDLGRFGLGLKTASFSQGRSLTVATKQQLGEPSIRRWDLDYVRKHNEWRLLMDEDAKATRFLEALADVQHGTLVIWRKLDRPVDDRPSSSTGAHESFQHLIAEAKEHLSMTFHRFLSGEARHASKQLQIFVNGSSEAHLLQAWDPFLRANPATQPSPIEWIGEGGSRIRVQGFVLPHKDRMTEDQYKVAAGPRGWNAQQGCYIYRTDRIIVPGDWLRLGRGRAFQKEEQYRLARLSVDITNGHDFDWSLDVKKSTARPPDLIRPRLVDLAEATRKRAREVFFHRQEVGPRPGPNQLHPFERAWITGERNGQTVYTVNRGHPFIEGVLQQMGHLRVDAEAMLRIIEETVPVERIWLDVAESPGDHCPPYEGLNEATIWSDLQRTREMLIAAGLTEDAAHQYLRGIEPFNRFPDLITRLAAR